MKIKSLMLLLFALIIALCFEVVLAEDTAKTGLVYTPDQLKWKASPRVPGVENAELVGNSSKEAYVYRAKFPPNFKMESHSHPEDRTYTVISGTWYIGWGDVFDESKLIPLPAGSFYTEPANVPHFVATKAETVVQITGNGPSAVKYVNPDHAPKK